MNSHQSSILSTARLIDGKAKLKALALQVLFFIEICFLNDLQYEEFEVVGFICGHKRRMVGRLGLEFDLPYDSATFSCGILKHFLEIG